MSDQPGTESFEDDLGSYSIDDATDAGAAQEELLDSSEGDNEAWSPPDQQPRNTEWGTTATEQATEETIDQRVAQEEPEEWDDDRDRGGEDSGSDGPEHDAMHIIED